MSSLMNRILRAAKLDAAVYKEVRTDERATIQALWIVIMSGMSVGIGSLREMHSGMFTHVVLALVSWLAMAFIIYFIGARILPESGTKSTPVELLRATGFSYSPGLIGISGLIPNPVGNTVLWIISVWMLVALVVAVKQALDYKSMLRAVIVSLLGWIIFRFVIHFLIVLIWGGSGSTPA